MRKPRALQSLANLIEGAVVGAHRRRSNPAKSVDSEYLLMTPPVCRQDAWEIIDHALRSIIQHQTVFWGASPISGMAVATSLRLTCKTSGQINQTSEPNHPPTLHSDGRNNVFVHWEQGLRHHWSNHPVHKLRGGGGDDCRRSGGGVPDICTDDAVFESRA